MRTDDNASKVVIGVLASLGSLLSGYIGQTFQVAEDRAMQQLSFYFQQPLVTSYLLGAERLSLKLTGQKRAALLADVVGEVLRVARAAEAATRSETGVASSGRRPRGGAAEVRPTMTPPRAVSADTGPHAAPEAA